MVTHNLSDDFEKPLCTQYSLLIKMDVMFTIDTSLVHLAGIMNKNIFIFALCTRLQMGIERNSGIGIRPSHF